MSAIAFQRAGAILRGFDVGAGQPLLFQHGLGGDADQVAENVSLPPGWRRLTLECRGQGGSEPGDARPFSIAGFAEDALAFCDARGVGRFVAGGLSMGAAIALRLAVRYPERVRALILARPAWTFDPALTTMRPYAEVAAALREADPAEAKRRFAASPTAALLAREAPDNLASLLGFFGSAAPRVTADLLADVAGDGPGVCRAEVGVLAVPTLVIGHAVDHVHAWSSAEALAATIPGATLVRVPPKAGERAAHLAAVRRAIVDFLQTLPMEPRP